MENKQEIPKELHHSLFFKDHDWHDNLIDSNHRKPFYYEMMAYRNELSEAPWNFPDSFIKEYFDQWNEIENEIRTLFSTRKRAEASIEMIYQIGYFIEAIFWINGKRAVPALLSERMSSLDIIPVNGKERVQYVVDHYDHYTSFVQLRQLVIELHKKWVKTVAIKRSQSDD